MISTSRMFYAFFTCIIVVVILVNIKCPPIVVYSYIFAVAALIAIKSLSWLITMYKKKIDKMADEFEDDELVDESEDFDKTTVEEWAQDKQQDDAVSKFDVIMNGDN